MRAAWMHNCRQSPGFGKDVKLEIEIRVIHPIGMIEIQRDPHQFLPENAGTVEPPFDIAQYVLETDLAAGGG